MNGKTYFNYKSLRMCRNKNGKKNEENEFSRRVTFFGQESNQTTWNFAP